MDQNTREVLTLVIPLLGTAFTGWIGYKMATLKTRVEGVVSKLDSVAIQVDQVEKATNSHTDLLVRATKAASHGEGMLQERAEAAARTAEQALGARGERIAMEAAKPPAPVPAAAPVGPLKVVLTPSSSGAQGEVLHLPAQVEGTVVPVDPYVPPIQPKDVEASIIAIKEALKDPEGVKTPKQQQDLKDLFERLTQQLR